MFDLWHAMKLDTTMSFLATALRRHCFALFLFLGIASFPAWSQTPPPDRPVLFNDQDGIVTSFVTAPTLQNGGGNRSPSNTNSDTNTQWLKVELHYSVSVNTDQPTRPGQSVFLPSAKFKVWIEGRDLLDPQGKPGEGIAVALTGSATYVNIPAGKDNYAVFYVHPNTLVRYSTTADYNDFDRKFNIHAEVEVNGQLSDYYDKKKERDLNWFKPLRVIDGLVYRQNQCVFLFDSPDRYPALKIEDQSSSDSAPAESAPPPPSAPTPSPAPSQ
jgi:hypothetical protein